MHGDWGAATLRPYKIWCAGWSMHILCV